MGLIYCAALLARQIDALHENILQQFWQPTLLRFRASTQSLPESALYPENITQLMPLLSGFEIPALPSKELYAGWMQRHKKEWFQHASLDYPWGLIALAAVQVDDRRTVVCWLANATPFRHGKHWNVLEEAIFQGLLSHPAGQHKLNSPHDCTKH